MVSFLILLERLTSKLRLRHPKDDDYGCHQECPQRVSGTHWCVLGAGGRLGSTGGSNASMESSEAPEAILFFDQ